MRRSRRGHSGDTMNKKLLAAAVAIVALGGVAAGVAYAQTIAMAGATIKVPEKADDFRLVDQNSKAHLLSYYKNSPARVIISAENGARTIRDAAPAIKE